jgi:hypothetical protein
MEKVDSPITKKKRGRPVGSKNRPKQIPGVYTFSMSTPVTANTADDTTVCKLTKDTLMEMLPEILAEKRNAVERAKKEYNECLQLYLQLVRKEYHISSSVDHDPTPKSYEPPSKV